MPHYGSSSTSMLTTVVGTGNIGFTRSKPQQCVSMFCNTYNTLLKWLV